MRMQAACSFLPCQDNIRTDVRDLTRSRRKTCGGTLFHEDLTRAFGTVSISNILVY